MNNPPYNQLQNIIHNVDVTQSHLYNAATTVASSITQPLPAVEPQTDASLRDLMQWARINNVETPFNIGRLYGKTQSIENLYAAIIESIKSKENDPIFNEKATLLLKVLQTAWQFFIASHGKQLSEPEILAIMSGYITSGYEKQKTK
jgi:hypothetical protein